MSSPQQNITNTGGNIKSAVANTEEAGINAAQAKVNAAKAASSAKIAKVQAIEQQLNSLKTLSALPISANGLGTFISSQLVNILKSSKRINKIIDSYIKQVEDTCPNTPITLSLITKTNQLNNGLNQIQSTLTTITNFTVPIGEVVTTLNSVINIIKALPIPMPPFTPVAVPNTFSSILNTVGTETTIISSILDAGNGAIKLIQSEFGILQAKLQLLDEFLIDCAQQNNIPPELVIATSFNLNNSNSNNSSNNSSLTQLTTENYNGFTLSIQNYPNNLSYPQHIGVATNSQGVVLLKTNPSFTSDPQTLLDELKFTIQQQNLKAN